jgi:hypothetical protein
LDAVYFSSPSKRYANVGVHLHRIQAMQQHVELQVELIDHNQDSDMALLNQIQLSGARHMCHHYALQCSHP